MTDKITADQILEQAKARGEKLEGQSRSEESLRKAQAALAAGAIDPVQQAAKATEDIIAFLNDYWNAHEFTPEERIFSIALATINLRQHFPADKGGTQEFDRVSGNAKKYWNEVVATST